MHELVDADQKQPFHDFTQEQENINLGLIGVCSRNALFA